MPVLIPLTAVAFALAIRWLRRRDGLTVPRAVVAAVACVYGAGILSHVLLPYPIGTSSGESWRVWLHLTPFVDVVDDPIGIVLNVALFVPLGVLLPLIGGVRSLGRALLLGFLVSLGIEVVQFLSAVTVSEGRIADVDDLIGNSLGVLLGYVGFRLAVRVPAVARLTALATWPPPVSPSPPSGRSSVPAGDGS
ncbi:VanZ family protein [Patulibacter defluvii]|uniref:VanZ family protein n=1 Tax=Patulibacter defluvii TaxID=3095358 RepID=UPI002A76126D|nr:VanZ family protein [Patulibacter sp. DM4]